ncbi:MAG: tetratricopeptide repeat protein [Planctomycetaceae bacterium]|jgi:tetratricopeptide (TPR) repeat protein|nr:tetratricopeptide repeat protein [Planctomycetaceae bacterium]
MIARLRFFVLFFLLSILSFGCVAALGADSDFAREFEEIQSAFDSAGLLSVEQQPEAFKRVAIMYQNLFDRGIRSGQLYYNQGNAWYYAGERGRAIASYKLALRYLPQDPRIIANLRVVGGVNVDVSPISSELGGRVAIIEYLFFWQNWVGVYQKIFYSTLFSIFLFVVCLIILFMRKGVGERVGGIRKVLRRFAIFLFAVTLISVLSAAYDWYRFECFSYVVISVEDAQPRKGNSEQYDKAFTRPVPLGTNALIISERGDWLHLRFGDMQDAWLPKSQVVRY